MSDELRHRLEHISRDLRLWRINHKMSKNLRDITLEQEDGDILYKCASISDLKELESLHLNLFRAPLISWIRYVYRFRAPQLISIAIDKKSNKIIGYDMYIFNESEVAQRIIHNVYVGVKSEYQGQGISTKLRKFSLNSYNQGVLLGASTISGFDDIKALRSAQKAGFYITKQSAKPRGHYLFYKFICHLV